MQVSLYHRSLRVALLVMTAVLLFDSGFIAPITRQFADITYLYIAAAGAGLYANVEETEINRLSAELNARSQELDMREALLKEREIAARDFGENSNRSTYIISAILALILVLVILNYILDYSRMRKFPYGQTT